MKPKQNKLIRLVVALAMAFFVGFIWTQVTAHAYTIDRTFQITGVNVEQTIDTLSPTKLVQQGQLVMLLLTNTELGKQVRHT